MSDERRSEIRSIPVNGGGLVLGRIGRCGISIHWSTSWADAKTLQIIVDLPPMPGDRDRWPYTDMAFWWVKVGGKWKPDGAGWAHDLMFNPAPLGSSQWLNC